ncbi:MAG: hypothetical protein RIS64_4626, partial [Bacteroidota bacterium]
MLGVQGAGVLDYVTAWYIKAAQLCKENEIRCAFVSTNSIAQGEQVGILWGELFGKYQMKIQFAHRTFAWSNEAKGNAAVHCVIIGFGTQSIDNKRIFDYENIKSEPVERKVKNINSYLVEGENRAMMARRKPICSVPEIIYGNKIVDGGYYLFTDDEKASFVAAEPIAAAYFKPILSGDEYLNGKNRWVLYLANINPTELKKSRLIQERVKLVAEYRQASTKAATQTKALTPTLFAEPRQPKTPFLLVPRTSSELRRYIPFGFFTPNYIVNDSCLALPNADLYLFGQLSCLMHMTWVKYVCGRLESRLRYSNTIVYNNYPFPQNVTEAQKQKVTDCAHKVLEIRTLYPESSLADLYDALAMPPDLVKAHQALDKAVD